VQGVLEWPTRLTVEPFVVVRTDDGRWYYAEIKAAKRLESAPLTAGGRVAVLGTEATRPHEITAIAVGSGDAAALAMALMPPVNPPAPAPAPLSVPTAESASPPKPVATEPPPTPKIVAKPEPEPAPAAPPAQSQVTEPAAEKPTPVRVTEAVPPEPPRWTELQGTVKVIAGNWVLVRADSGQLVLVDLSTVRGGATSLQPGSSIAVYGTPGDQKFQAMGILQPGTRPAARPATVPPRR